MRPEAVGLLLSAIVLALPMGADGVRAQDVDIHSFHRGDSDTDGEINLTDAVVVFAWLFLGGEEPPCLDAVDSNDDGEVSISDGIYTLGFLFSGGAAIPEPGLDLCGLDPTEDALGCRSYFPCACGGFLGRPCPEDHVCEFPAASCSGADMLGYCLPRPSACPKFYQPVCGCDGQTYGNDCERLRAGVTKDYEGECAVSACAPEECTKEQFCEKPDGACDRTDARGTCVDRPGPCPEDYDPVCGCDGITYGNDCERRAAGVSKDHDGECEGPPPGE